MPKVSHQQLAKSRWGKGGLEIKMAEKWIPGSDNVLYWPKSSFGFFHTM